MNSTVVPSVALVVGGILWGLVWIPLRSLAEYGISGGWPGLLVYFGVSVMLLVPTLFVRGLVNSSITSLFWCGIFTGSAFSLYGISLFYTDVVRVLLLFYVTPVWSTLLGAFFLKEKLSKSRFVALVLGISGLMVVLGIGTRFPWPENLGDWLALSSGFCWSIGTILVFRMKSSGVYEQVLAFTIGGVIVSILALAVGGSVINTPITYSDTMRSVPILVATMFMLIPMLFLTVWPAKLLSPGRVGLLLMSEVIVGIGSAALLTGEAFGAREIVGTLLIVSAGLVEVVGNNDYAQAKLSCKSESQLL